MAISGALWVAAGDVKRRLEVICTELLTGAPSDPPDFSEIGYLQNRIQINCWERPEVCHTGELWWIAAWLSISGHADVVGQPG